MVFVDPNYPRTSNMIEGFHLGFKSKVNRPKPTVQEYFKAVGDQQVSTDYHLDRLEHGMTPAKKRKTNNHGGGVQQQKRSCRREKPKMSFVFFVLFCSFSKHVQNRRFCVEFGQKCVQKKNKIDNNFRIF